MLIIIGTVLGFLSGLGIGGGSLLLIWLTAVLRTDPWIAKTVNLMFFLPTSLIACILRSKNHRLDLKMTLPGVVGGCFASLLGYWLSTMLDTWLLKKLFGMILILTGLKELFYRPRNAR